MELFEKVNLRSALQKIEHRSHSQAEETLAAFRNLFKAEWEYDNHIHERLAQSRDHKAVSVREPLPAENIYHISAIRKLCLQYRLRFLPTRHFSGEFPLETLRAVKELEKKLEIPVDSFYLLAPARYFKLEDANQDPLLFVPLDDERYYLVHQWGNDLAWYRRFLAWPMQRLSTLLASVFLINMLITLSIPGRFITESGEYFSFSRAILFVYMLLSSAALLSYIWFATNRKLSSDAWNSHTYN